MHLAKLPGMPKREDLGMYLCSYDQVAFEGVSAQHQALTTTARDGRLTNPQSALLQPTCMRADGMHGAQDTAQRSAAKEH